MTTLYPNGASPEHGVFVENRLAAFSARSGAEFRVVAPIPWFPIAAPIASRYAAYARAPRAEARRSIEILHPRYAIPPKIGMHYAPHALARAFLKAARELIADGWDFDAIDAHYFFPDGVAAAAVARRLNKPLVITARGSDINDIPRGRRARRQILDAAHAANAVIAVADALKTEMISLGVDGAKIRVLRNGVDLARFRPLDRDRLRREAGLAWPVLASVGHLIPRKGHELVIDALSRIDGATLLIVGDGEERRALERQAERAGVADRTRFLGRIAHERLAEVYNMADVLTLASSREGWPNVLLEAMACGAPVVATDVWGSSEVVRAPAAGRLVARTPEAIAEAVRGLLAAPPARADTRAYAEQFSWDETSDGLAAVFAGVVRAAPHARRVTAGRRRPRLIVTVDTEEEFDWGEIERGRHSVCAPDDIARFQTIAAEAGAKPLYFLTYPVIRDPKASAYFAALHASGVADLGAHLHAWVTPPLAGAISEAASWQCALPHEEQTAKLKTLVEAFEAAFGFKATAHRAGRYGVDPACYAAMAAAGFAFDFSPSPGFIYTAQGGPDFSGMSNAPFVMKVDGARLWVTPVSGGRAFRGARIFAQAPNAPAGFRTPPRRIRDLASAPMRLTPEGATLADLKALARRLIADDTPVLTFSLHSTTLSLGANPYAQSAADIDAALATTAKFLTFFRDELGGEFLDLSSLMRQYGA